MKIPVAEDDTRLLKSLLHIFTLNKFSVDGVSDGKEALEYALTGEYDGLVFDIMMPGIEVLKALRKENITTPALFLTARTEVSQRVEGLDAGADDYLPKPFSTAELLYTYEEYLEAADTLYEVVQLRGKSIKGQVEGTIPSTGDEQRNSDALVDASHLNLSVMGSMSMGDHMKEWNESDDNREEAAGSFYMACVWYY